MSGARALADAGRPLGRAAVIGEPTGLKPIRLHKGVMMERIDILGQSGHSSDPTLGHSALEAMTVEDGSGLADTSVT
jgi:acetylornithine deacetylase